jgi:hypothetical protein
MRKGGIDKLGTYVYNVAFIEVLEQKQGYAYLLNGDQRQTH